TDWIVVATGASGTGNGVVNLTIAANSGAARTGAVTVADHVVNITQSQAPPSASPGPPAPPTPPSCDLSITPPAQTFSANGGNGTVSVNVQADCSWTATSGAAWITVASGTSGSGSGEIHFVVAANPNTASRQGVLTIGTRTFTVAQAGLSCTYTVQ